MPFKIDFSSKSIRHYNFILVRYHKLEMDSFWHEIKIKNYSNRILHLIWKLCISHKVSDVERDTYYLYLKMEQKHFKTAAAPTLCFLNIIQRQIFTGQTIVFAESMTLTPG